ncbi:peptide ABC transporter [Devosia sp. Root413D1]|uniref:ABC transporter substrate-binding protein n=1 Tax=Devosia sp. Root413D1 TaxID=1736531 RepID=UPI0006F9E00B|nr:ABC transporter substrate-binding protein [Devosia sp. Root413D1]KQW83522.1 peptide ABC transporter [Devosia sp. Root413D1]
MVGWKIAAVLAIGAAVTTPAFAETLRWAPQRDIVSMDPYSFGDTFTLSVLNHVYEGLVRYDETLQIEPALAESWEVVSPTKWRFKLRQGVKYHDGAEFTADDVLASLKRVSDPTSPLRGNLPAYVSSEKIDDYTVDINVTENYPLLLNDLTNIHIFDGGWLTTNNAEAPTDVAKGVEGYATSHANGTGPFKFISRQPDVQTVFEVNPEWWDERQHNIDKIVMTPITSSATRVAALISGEIDFTNQAPLQDLPRLEATAGLKVLSNSELRTIFFVLNQRDKAFESDVTDKNPLQDIKVRQALYHAIDADSIQKVVMSGLSRTTGSLVSPAIPGYVPELDERLAYDPELAKSLLAEAGYPNGFSFSFLCRNTEFVNEEQICQAVAAMWSRIGLRPNLNLGPTTIQDAKFDAGQFDVGTLGWANEPMLDSYSILVQVVHSKTGNAGVFNWGGWSDAQIDANIDEAGRTVDRATRLDLQAKALLRANELSMFIPVHQQPMAWATGAKVVSVLQLNDNKARHWLTRMAE